MPSTDEAPAVASEARPASGSRSPSPSPSDAHSEGEYTGSDRSTPEPSADNKTQPPLPDEPVPEGQAGDTAAPPLPNEPVPEQPEDDGWEYHWNPNDQSYWFWNRFTGIWQKENPRVPSDYTTPATAPGAATTTTFSSATAAATIATAAPGVDSKTTVLSNPASIAGGYNPAIHGSYDENAWYAQNLRATTTTTTGGTPPFIPATHDTTTATTTYTYTSGNPEYGAEYATEAFFNRHTGQWQLPEQGAERHSDEAKARRQMRAYFDVDAAANMHDGRSVKAERSGIKPTRAELKAFKERRRQKKEEKRRAWLRD
ncbi:hypothetical protein N656DRAFT_788398 [Canariomyces notabilis]|uniref:WW domain-containing protein n=1 Tax=Canariomyces notabilis TaxID=2074819 RepID=A0AAN6TGQ4_9PEZI|nr:hypothetical protein N656DRAFT_788398 [Canariomyces arenarius]